MLPRRPCAAAGVFEVPCYRPLDAWQTAGGEVVFRDVAHAVRSLRLPCGQCVGCRLERSRQWAVRCVHEAKLHPANSFLTLTYRPEVVPDGLVYRDFQLFMKRLRKRAPKGVRFFMCGEYMPKGGAPHFHCCLFGGAFADQRYFKKTDAGERIYTSAALSRLWPYGYSSIGELNFRTAAYTARYCVSKLTGPNVLDREYGRIFTETGEIFPRVAEFCHMSLKPGIGRGWFDKYYNQVYPSDRVVINGKEAKPPKYYDRLYSKIPFSHYEDVVDAREFDAYERADDNTSERLAVKEVVRNAGIRFFSRKMK